MSELKVTTESDYVTNDLPKRKNQGKKYNQSVKFEVEGGTREALLKVGGTHSSAQKAFSDLPSFETGL
ncbi:hypothetical protein [Clostridium saccharoperbutylacetonicum]|uniref:hypothetical protein n=1 Tax=Clostridium saccharoperbutylacetonicum TaxID=36745 RepID=UPI0039E89A9D